MKKLFLVVMACYGLTARAQLHDSKNFVYLYSDSVIHAKRIQMRPDFSGYWQLRVDSRRLPLERVKFFSNEDGFFANTRRLNSGYNTIAERIVEGKINLFQGIAYNNWQNSEFHSYPKTRISPIGPLTYYNKGFDDLKKTNYRNLKIDLADHPESMDLLKSYRKKMNTGVKLYAVAGVLAVIGSAVFLSDHNSSGFGRFNSSLILLSGSLGFTTAGYLIRESASSRLEEAVDAYNR